MKIALATLQSTAPYSQSRSYDREVEALPRETKDAYEDRENRRVISYKAMLGAVALIADGNKARTVAAAVDPAKPIPPQNILEMFRQ